MGKIFYIMGKSASGKDRIYSLLVAHKELNLKTLILYTTRPIRAGEQDGKNYYFVDDGKLEEFRKNGNLIEERAYHTVYGIWTYFTADDGQVNLADSDYLGIGTLESFKKMHRRSCLTLPRCSAKPTACTGLRRNRPLIMRKPSMKSGF